ncbi:CHAT domain-containing protein [Lactarius quietus]|nr:CHAT domain-containing protein [Lactarius quietus]
MDPESLEVIAKIDDGVAIVEDALSQLPRSDPMYITGVCSLATARYTRYTLSQQKEDLDKSILHLTEAILLPHNSLAGPDSNVVELLFRLVCQVIIHPEKVEQPEHITYSITYLRYLRRLPLESLDIPRNDVTKFLIRQLASQVKLKAGDGTQKIEEMLVLCCELLPSKVSADFPADAFMFLSEAAATKYIRGRSVQLLNKVIECLRDAVEVCPPGSHRVSLGLAKVLCTRASETHSNGDYEDAMALLERIVDPDQPEECPDSIRIAASALASSLAFLRSSIFPNPEYTEVAISHQRAILNSPNLDEKFRFSTTEALASRARERFTQYRLSESLEEANSYVSQVVDFSSSQSLGFLAETDAVQEAYNSTAIQQKIQHFEELLSNTPPGTEHYEDYLTELANCYKTKFSRTNDPSDIEKSINFCRLSLDSTHHSHPLSVHSLICLRNILLLAYERTHEINCLDESILLGYNILELKGAQYFHFPAIRHLISSLLSRLSFLGQREDLDEVLRLMPLASRSQYARAPDLFEHSCDWAYLARHMQHPSVLRAYKSAMSLMQKSLSFAPTAPIQHTRLVETEEHCQSLPLDYASYQIVLGQFEEAIETLEQGRTLLWSEMRGLRTPIGRIIQEESPATKRLAEINQELEALTTSLTPSATPEIEVGIARGRSKMDPFGRLVVEQQKLVKERDALIQGPPVSERILGEQLFGTLRSAASRGPVIIINHSRWHSDILIIFRNYIPCAIPTVHGFYDRANKLRDKLMDARRVGLDSAKYQHALRTVLRDLYELIGQPVLKRLRVLGVPEQSRVWWCPTSVFCSLPLHAMGPIPSEDMLTSSRPSMRYFSDIYIPSYTPSLSALIESRNSSSQALDRPSLLLIAQPDESLPGVWGEIEVMHKLKVPVTSLISKRATPTSVIESLRDHRFAHFACHGNLETGKPFDASFQLHGGERLTLLEIVRSRLPNAEFAFLSCCHTAEITDESIADEALHLTAAMQYCGFRSVVGTMWAMADTDGQDLAKNFYKSLFSNRGQGVPYYERSARALRDATRKLRRMEGITLERWVNFVHYGA